MDSTYGLHGLRDLSLPLFHSGPRAKQKKKKKKKEKKKKETQLE
jgi:hypothetical protein